MLKIQDPLYQAWVELIPPSAEDIDNFQYIETYWDTEAEAIEWLRTYSPSNDYDYSNFSLGDRGINVLDKSRSD